MSSIGGPQSLPLRRSGRAHAARLAAAVGVACCWLAIGLADLLLSVMLFTDPNLEVLVLCSPMLLAIPWIVSMANARGCVVVRHGALEIRHRRVLRRPLVLAREQVARILLDDGAATGRARFPTGEVSDPLLWTDPVPRRQRPDRPLLGDALLPNVAIVLDRPLRLDMARDAITAVPVAGDIDPPPRRAEAKALLLAVEDLETARRVLTGWPVEQPVASHVIPPQVAIAAARVPRDAATVLALALVGAALLTSGLPWLLPLWFAGSLWFTAGMVRRRRDEAQEARADVDRRTTAMTPAERAAALAAIDANLGGRGSQGPPGWSGSG